VNILIGYGSVVVFFALIVFVLERTKEQSRSFTEYAVAGRSFGAWFQTMAFLNTWLPGTVFISIAGFYAGGGVIGFYATSYSLLAMLFMFFMAQPVHNWGRQFDLRTQADFVGMRYNSKVVRVVAATIGIVSLFPWLVLGLQSLGLVFSFLSFGSISFVAAVFVGIFVLSIRQIWTVRMGMRGVVISDMVQGIVAYGVGGCIALGFVVWLLSNGHGFDKLPASFAVLPGPGSTQGPLYFMSIVLTGALGAWCWPDIFVRLFTGKSTATIKRSSLQSAPLLFIFMNLLGLMAMLAHSLPEVASAPDRVWFLTASNGGVLILSLAGVAVLAATMGNVNAITSAIGTQVAQDIIHINKPSDTKERDARVVRTAKISIVVVTILAVAGAVATVNVTSGLVKLALTSYQGIVQLAPSLYFGLFWRRGNALGAAMGMIVGFVVAAAFEVIYPTSIPWLGGLTSGVAGMIVNAVIYVAFAYLLPASNAERSRIDALFDSVGADGVPVEVDSGSLGAAARGT
jgi:SSS family solute:Na+ symporter